MTSIVIDLGTTNVKMYLFINDKIISTKSFVGSKNKKENLDLNYITYEIYKIFKEFFNYSNEKQVNIIFSNAMHTLIVLDEFNVEIIPSTNLLYSNFKLDNQNLEFQHKTGMIPGIHLPIFRIKKLLDENKINIGSIKRITTLKSYLFWKLTNKFLLEVSDAAGTGWFNIKSLDWNYGYLKSIGLENIIMDDIVDYNYSAESTLFGKKIIVSLGISDGPLLGYVAGKKINGSISISVGTTLGIRTLINNKIIPNSEGKIYNIPVTRNNHILGISTNNGANNIENFLQFNKLDLTNLSAKLQEVNNIHEFYYPNIFKERFHINFDYKKSIDEILNESGIDKSIYVLFEGMAFMIRYYLEELERILNIEERRPIIVSGGFFNEKIVRKFVANKLQRDIFIMEEVDLAAHFSLQLIDNLIEKSSKLNNNLICYKYIKNKYIDIKYLEWSKNISY